MADSLPPCPSTEALYEEAPCGLLVTAPDGTIRRANATFCRWLGYSAEELVDRRRLQDLITMGGRIFFQTHWVPLLQLQGSVAEVKIDMLRRDGSKLPVLLNALRREVASQTWHEVSVVVAEDRHRYEHELLLARRKADELLRAERDRALFAEQMVGIVSHDLRNPLGAVKLSTLVLARTALNGQQTTTLQRIVRSVDRANKLVTDLLDFTQARIGGGLSVSPQPIDVQQVMAEAVDELAGLYPGRSLVYEHTGDTACMADRHRLVQLLGNLVSNAMAYGDAHTPVTTRSVVDGTALRISVHNAGPVIPLALQKHIFDPMTRGDSAGGHMRSVGLGLYIVREIARAHGGQMVMESSAEAGTVFTMLIPR